MTMDAARQAQERARLAAQEARSLYEEFRNFAFKGNVVDLAVGVVIGGAFSKIIDSLVRNVITPLISYVTPSTSFAQWHVGRVMIGNFLNDVLSFLIVSAALFLFIVKFLGWVMRSRSKQQAEAPPTKDQILLTEIRDLLKARAAGPAGPPVP